MMDAVVHFFYVSWVLLGQMAPYLLFGFLMAGVLSVSISPEFVEQHLGGRGFKPVLKATLLGIPLPLCSCGVLPVAAGFRRHGASRAATTAFLLSTPQTGVDSIVVTYALLGTALAIYRPLVALATGLLGGLLVMLFAQPNHSAAEEPDERKPCTESCCTEKHSGHIVLRALRYGFITLPRDIGPALLVGVLVGGAIAAFATPKQWQPYLGGGIFSMILMLGLGIPLYVCASASVPIAVGFIHAGASPGAALAFLIAGPATNAATLTMIWKLLGVRSCILFLLAIVISALGGGLLFDAFAPNMQIGMSETLEHCHDVVVADSHASFWAVVLLGIVAFAFFSKFQTTAMHRHENTSQKPFFAEQITLKIAGMTCSHCTTAVSKAIRACPGVADVEIDLLQKIARVQGEHLNAEIIISAVTLAGYQAEVVAKPVANG